MSDTEPLAESDAIRALWWLKQGNWDRAHELVQNESPHNDWVHAHLHRVEGDLINAGYWYQKAGKPICTMLLDDEFDSMLKTLSSAKAP